MNTITFFSYKGGACRSSTTLNVLPFLARRLGATPAAPVLLLDMDLDSAGMTYLLDLDEHFRAGYDVKSLLSEGFPGTNQRVGSLASHPFFSKLQPVGDKFGVEAGSILFLGADDQKPLDNNEMGGDKPESIKKLKQAARANGFKAVVIDSAAGDQFSAKIATAAANVVAVCMRPTMQFRAGTFAFLDRFIKTASNKHIVVVPTAVPASGRKIGGEDARAAALDKIAARLGLYKNSRILTDFVTEGCFGIPEVERFKWQEGVLNLLPPSDLTPDEAVALDRYDRLAALVGSVEEGA